MKLLRKTLVLNLCGEEVAVEVDFRLVEAFERGFGVSADALLEVFSNKVRVQRRHVAEVLVEVMARMRPEWKRADVREEALTLSPIDFAVLVSQLNTGLLFTLRQMTPEEFDAIAAELSSGKKKPPVDLPTAS